HGELGNVHVGVRTRSGAAGDERVVLRRKLEELRCNDHHRAVTSERRRMAADASVIGGGAAMVASAFAHWVSRGTGSGLRGHALFDAIIVAGRHFPGMSGARLTVLWYLVPASGAASWIAMGLRGVGSRAARAIAVVAVIVVVGSIGAVGRLVG